MPFEPAPKTEQEDRVAIGRIALEAIAAHILTVPPENFDMSRWCGTACCAIGHGVSLPEVRATGLYLASAPDGYQGVQSHWPAFGQACPISGMGMKAISRAFGISEHQASELFGGWAGQRAEDVSARIRRCLRGEIPAEPIGIEIAVSFRHYGGFSWITDDLPHARKPRKAPAVKVRTNAKTGATWPVARGAYA